MATVKYQSGGVKAPIDGQLTIEVARIHRARLTGFLFETNKTFLVPAALSGIREVGALLSGPAAPAGERSHWTPWATPTTIAGCRWNEPSRLPPTFKTTSIAG